MKLLASLLGAAVADYACCPYDHYGVVYSGCPLTEKTPWAMDDNNHDRWGVEHHMCKAWEANVDATFEGTEDYDNWGGCGFQRHFPWYWGPKGVYMENEDVQNVNNEKAEMHCRLGYFNCDGNQYTTNYHGFMPVNQNKVNPIIHRLDTSTAAFTASGHAAVVGKVHLGAVCKLWIPVRRKFIDSVSVAGVHLFGGGNMAGNEADHTLDNGKASVFDETWVCADDVCENGANHQNNGDRIAMGTSYCFSVVNIGEFMENWHGREDQLGKQGQFNVMNGNVAGRDEGGHDPIKLPGPVFEHEFEVNFGDPIDNFDNSINNPINDPLNPVNPSNPVNNPPGMNTIVEGGANFDVVVHFKSQWCMRHWKVVDMQQYDLIHSAGNGPERHPDWISVNNGHDDWGSMEHDYIINKDYQDPSNPAHAHTDVMDKRIDAVVGMGGCCFDQTGDGTGPFIRYDDDFFFDFGDVWRPTPPVASGCQPCDRMTHSTNLGNNQGPATYQSHNFDGADLINTYSGWFLANNMQGQFHWPNAGAWAAFHSFITCADNQFMIYDMIESVDEHGEVTLHSDRKTPQRTRAVVHSMFYNDIRHDYTNAAHGTGDICIRGNLRQVGTKVVYCGPGVINTMQHQQSIAEDDTFDADGDHIGGPNNDAPNLWLTNNVDYRRCTWNWNFHEGFEHIMLLDENHDEVVDDLIHRDPEHFFERNNPTYQRVWGRFHDGVGAPVPRGHDWSNYDGGNPDLPHLPGFSNGHDIYVRPVVETVTFTISFQTDKDHGPDYLMQTGQHLQMGVVDGDGIVAVGANNPLNEDPYDPNGEGHPDSHPNNYQFFLDAPKYFTPQNEIEIRVNNNANPNVGAADQAHQVTFSMWCLESSLDGTGTQMPFNAPSRRDGYGHEQSPIDGSDDYAQVQADIDSFVDNFDDDVQYRDRFPDCFMGDEIHFEYIIRNGENQFVGAQSNNEHHRISAWYSYVDVSFQSSEATNPQSQADIDLHNPIPRVSNGAGK